MRRIGEVRVKALGNRAAAFTGCIGCFWEAEAVLLGGRCSCAGFASRYA